MAPGSACPPPTQGGLINQVTSWRISANFLPCFKSWVIYRCCLRSPLHNHMHTLPSIAVNLDRSRVYRWRLRGNIRLKPQHYSREGPLNDRLRAMWNVLNSQVDDCLLLCASLRMMDCAECNVSQRGKKEKTHPQGKKTSRDARFYDGK